MFVKPKPKIKLKNTQNKIYFALIEVKIYTRFSLNYKTNYKIK